MLHCSSTFNTTLDVIFSADYFGKMMMEILSDRIRVRVINISVSG